QRDLLNLQSNLSPKYIGYSPTNISADDQVRTTRRRNNAAASSPAPSREGESDTAASPLLTAQPQRLMPNGSSSNSNSYMSPIDKLLLKNGANSPNSTGFEADEEDATTAQPSRKQLKRKLKRGSKSKSKPIIEVQPAALQAAEAEQQPVLHESSVKIEPVEASCPTPVKTEEMPEERKLKQEPEPEPMQEQESHLQFALPAATGNELDSLKSPQDNNSEQSMKSPSSISIDSAKGSSIVTDPGWPTYQVGDLYWGKLFTYCYWPCMVCPDEFGQIVGNPQVHPQRKSTDSAQGVAVPIQVHVRFFADNGRHNWIKAENLLPFAGLKAFEDMREEVRIKHGPKSSKYRQMVAKQNKLLIWRQAIDEALEVAQMPYDERLNKFFEIHEKAVTLNKAKKTRRKRNKLLLPQDTSDVGSSLYDSMDNLQAVAHTQVAIKRDRSSSPFSPAFSPVKHNHQQRTKRRKLSDGAEANVATTAKTEPPATPDLGNFQNPEFGQLFEAVKEYVMVHRQEEKVEKVLLAVVRNIWSLKQLQLRELERDLASGDTSELLGSARLGTDRGRGVGTVKRLSNRLKTIVLRRSMTPVVTPHSVAARTPESVRSESQQPEQQPKVKQPVGRPVEEVIDDILQLDRKYLFRGLNREPVCKYCHKPGGELERCSQGCHSWLHAACLEQEKPKRAAEANKEMSMPSARSSPVKQLDQQLALPAAHITGDGVEQQPLICQECATGRAEPCCICHQEQVPIANSSPQKEPPPTANEDAKSSELISCNQPMCNKRFHASCCKYWPQASISSSSAASRCPMHVCHTCVSDDPSGKYQQLGSAKLTKCVKCPATYHQDSRCIPAGSQMLTITHLICPRHNIAKADANLNVLWCYICVRGGELLCCETCPIAVHAHCRNIPIKTNESYICEECESGRLPLYGEIVWAKFTNFRWWPSIILPPTEIPNNILKKPHGPNDFVVRFFGTNDHGWISRRRVYLYIEGDTGDGHKGKSLMSKRYTIGVEEATRFLKIIKAKRQEQAIDRFSGNKLQPPPYIKIKANKPVPPVRFAYNEEDVNICECKPGTAHPCGPESGCLNRMLYHECNPDYCHAGTQCENQMFEQRRSPRLDVVYMNERGFGLVCREPIAEGDFIIEYVGEVINHAEFQRRMTQKTHDRDENFYFLGVEKDFIIDAGPKGNLARFMNHSCEPNCTTQKWTVNCINRVGLFAIKDIPENTELTFNYLWDDLMNNGKKACFCGAKRCSGEIGGKLKEEESK
ncbi:hypothetical protein KR222_000779, partial [Zaprionus bogoriensis]